MATYLILSLPFLFVASLLAFYVSKSVNWQALLIVFASLVVLTAIFDNLIIYLNIVNYDNSKLLGFFIGLAPLEDFAYTIFAILFTVCLYKLLQGKIKT